MKKRTNGRCFLRLFFFCGLESKDNAWRFVAVYENNSQYSLFTLKKKILRHILYFGVR